ncbi:acetate kinase [Anaerotruncus sp. X29]|jgi:acetate kinase|uniref:acetate/propionate family kinase n=1 Tax=Anaerotruncus sp. G3(2012) TaxID=1235835 RepID=UPI00034056E3|nr:acetate kinase [Anaerotruncus sp. G3(2012)]EOS63133.1 acetate kinase [Anaerotruncus sp. G3(2012)]MCI9159403.1 acetate kinase [Anaerotruncus sp.]MCI9235128.1 acetate kinase [Anaerotruncus sp.]NCE73982.1 acetate kinase [Anaerotruncus sp. X29]
MKVLVINAGSSSLKYQLIDMESEQVLAKGNCERIGIGGVITHKTASDVKISYEKDFPTHTEAFKELVKLLSEGENRVVENVGEITAIGQRVVHGGEKFNQSVVIDDEVLKSIEEFSDLAPLHNPAAVLAIKAAKEVFGEVPQVAVFDTSFHATMPPKAYIFGIPYEYYEKYHVRRYGFHGTSHRYVSGRLFDISGQVKKENSRVIVCHLGNGSSLSAVKNGKSVDTSMGFTPLDGFIMGTRSGGVDDSIITYLMEKEQMSAQQINDMLNKKSGLLGISGVSSDKRDLTAAADAGNERAQLADEILCYQVSKFIGSYAAALGGVDAVAFTGGIGENDTSLREKVCEGLGFLGIEIDKQLNDKARGGAEMKVSSGKTEVWVIPTNEELLIARDTRDLVQ